MYVCVCVCFQDILAMTFCVTSVPVWLAVWLPRQHRCPSTSWRPGEAADGACSSLSEFVQEVDVKLFPVCLSGSRTWGWSTGSPSTRTVWWVKPQNFIKNHSKWQKVSQSPTVSYISATFDRCVCYWSLLTCMDDSCSEHFVFKLLPQIFSKNITNIFFLEIFRFATFKLRLNKIFPCKLTFLLTKTLCGNQVDFVMPADLLCCSLCVSIIRRFWRESCALKASSLSGKVLLRTMLASALTPSSPSSSWSRWTACTRPTSSTANTQTHTDCFWHHIYSQMWRI